MADQINNPIDNTDNDITGSAPRNIQKEAASTAESLLFLQGLLENAWKMLQTIANNPLTSGIAIKQLGNIYQQHVIKNLERHISLLKEQNNLTSAQERSIRNMADASARRMSTIFALTGFTAGAFFKIAQLQEQLEITGAKTPSYGAANSFQSTQPGTYGQFMGTRYGLGQDPYKSQAIAIDKIKNILMWRYGPDVAKTGTDMYEAYYPYLKTSKTYSKPQAMANFIEGMAPFLYSQAIDPGKFPELIEQYKFAGGTPETISGFLNVFSEQYQQHHLMNLGGSPSRALDIILNNASRLEDSGMARTRGAPLLSSLKLASGLGMIKAADGTPLLSGENEQELGSLIAQFSNSSDTLPKMMAASGKYGDISKGGKYLSSLARNNPMELLKEIAQYTNKRGAKNPDLVTGALSQAFTGLPATKVYEYTQMLASLDSGKLAEINKVLKEQILNWEELNKKSIKTIHDIPQTLQDATNKMPTPITYMQAILDKAGLIMEQTVGKRVGYEGGAIALGLGALALGKFAGENPIGAILGYDILKNLTSKNPNGGVTPGGGSTPSLISGPVSDSIFLATLLRQKKGLPPEPLPIPTPPTAGPIITDAAGNPISSTLGTEGGMFVGRFAGLGAKALTAGKFIGGALAIIDGLNTANDAAEGKNIAFGAVNTAADLGMTFGGPLGLAIGTGVRVISGITQYAMEKSKTEHQKMTAYETAPDELEKIISNYIKTPAEKENFTKKMSDIKAGANSLKMTPSNLPLMTGSGALVYNPITKAPSVEGSKKYATTVTDSLLSFMNTNFSQATDSTIIAKFQDKIAPKSSAGTGSGANTSQIFIHIVDGNGSLLTEQMMKAGQQANLYVQLAGVKTTGK